MNIGFLGCGNMGSALARTLGCDTKNTLFLYDIDEGRVVALKEEIGAQILDTEEKTKNLDYLFLAVKPHQVDDVLSSLYELLKESNSLCIVSVAAGITLATLDAQLPEGTPVIRMMPNTSVGVGCGMTVYAKNTFVTQACEENFLTLLKPTGLVDALPEEYIDAESAIAGSGPAFAYMFLDALADGGVFCGLGREKALLYASKMLEGAARVYLESKTHPAKLKDAVCSPGGSSIEGVLTLEKGAFRSLVSSAVVRTCEKAKRLGKKE